jgi:hypothetical protein
MTSRLIEQREPTPEEREERGGEVVFVRETPGGRVEVIHACRMEGGTYQPWGAPRDVLGDNVGDVTAWAQGEEA